MPARKPLNAEQLALVGEWNGSAVDRFDEFVFNYWTRLKNSREQKSSSWGPWLFWVLNDNERGPKKNEYDNNYSLIKIIKCIKLDWDVLLSYPSDGPAFSDFLLAAIEKRRRRRPPIVPPVFTQTAPAVPRAVLTRDQFVQGKALATSAAQSYTDEVLVKWPHRARAAFYISVSESYFLDDRFWYFNRNQGLFDPVESLLNCLVVAHIRARDKSNEENKKARKALEAEVVKPTYPVTIDVDEFASRPWVFPMIKKSINECFPEPTLFDIPEADVEQIAGDVICKFLQTAKSGEIKAEFGERSYTEWIKAVAVRKAGDYAKESWKERSIRAEPPEEDPGVVKDARDDTLHDSWLGNMEDSLYAGRRKGKKTLGVPDSHRYGQDPEAGRDRQDAERLTVRLLGDDGMWLSLRAATTADGDHRAAEIPYKLLASMDYTKNQVKRSLQTAWERFCLLKDLLYDGPIPVHPKEIPTDRRSFNAWVKDYVEKIKILEHEKQRSLQRWDGIPTQSGKCQRGKRLWFVPNRGYLVPEPFTVISVAEMPAVTGSIIPWPRDSRKMAVQPISSFKSPGPSTLKPYRDKKTGILMPPPDVPIFASENEFWYGYKQIDHPGCGTIEKTFKKSRS